MSQIDVSIKLRPIRFLFLVKPSDSRSLQKIFEINTCLWGGMYNPIIPYFKRIPSWWDRKSKFSINARKTLDYILDFFEPDFVVEANPGMAKSLNLCPKITLQIDDILKSPNDTLYYESYGLNVFELYKHMYQKEFKFVRRHEHRIFNIKSEKNRLKLFCSCIFGSFPQHKSLLYIEDGFQEAFEPKAMSLNSEKFSPLYSKGFASALEIGCEKLDVRHSNHHYNPTLFLLNASNPRDLIDFWNLRIIEKNVLAIPIEWIDNLSKFCKNFISKNYRPLSGNPNGVMISPTIQIPRSMSEEEGQKICDKHLKPNNKDRLTIRFWYPPFWRPASDSTSNYSKPIIKSMSKQVQCEISEPANTIIFDSLYPEFADDHINSCNCANVIELDNMFFNDNIAIVYPNNMEDTMFPNLSLGSKDLLINTSGFVTFPSYRNSKEFWHLQDGTTAIAKWLERQTIESTISQPGKLVLQVVKTLGGIDQLSSIANHDIIIILNKMAQKQVLTNNNNSLPPKSYPTKTIQHSRLKELLNGVNQKRSLFKFTIEKLVEGNVIKLGIEIKCNECKNWNWLSIDMIDYELKCESCLSNFTFPTSDPTSKAIKWSYRAIGPFSNPDYAGGAYATVFSLRFFKSLLSFDKAKITWSTSLNMHFGPEDDLEIDYLFWYKRKRGFNKNYKPKLVFGESKSFAKKSFTEKDILRLKKIAIKFPGSIFVFSSMKKNLSKSEKEIIKSFAEWGRESTKYGESKAPVIVLTATELFARHDLSIEWKNKGGKHASLIKPAYIRIENLKVLANFTQHLYLGLDLYDDWWRHKFEKKKEKN